MKTTILSSPRGLALALAFGWSVTAFGGSALVGLWRFNEASGDTALDSSGLGNHGVLTVIPGELDIKPERVPGPTGFGGALSFTNNGDSSYPHSMVYVPGTEALKIGMTADDAWSIAAWTYERSDGGGGFGGTYGRLFAQDDGLSLNFNSGANGDAQYYIWHNSVTDWQQGFGTAAVVVPVLDQWVHLALVYNGTNLTLYRNGNVVAQGGAKTSIPVHAAINHGDYGGYHGALQIGTMPNMANRNWNGMIDDFAMFRGALTENEVRAIMAGDFSAYLNGPPVIALQPADQVVNQGLTATFIVAACSGSPMTYQWRFNGVDLPGATTSSLTISNVQPANAGAYIVRVSNAAGASLSVEAILTTLVQLPPRLIGLWRFDEGTGTNALDSSGLGNNGVLTTDDPVFGQIPTWATSQPGFGHALQFRVDNLAHSYVDIPANASLQFGMTANDTWTISAWTYEASDGGGNFVSSYGRLFAQNGGYGLNFDSGSSIWSDPQYYIWHDQLTAWQQGFGTGAAVAPILDQWIHLALVYDGTSLTLYRNGNQGPLGAKTSLPINAGLAWDGYGSEIQIGSINNSPSDHNWNGMIDDFAIFSGALSESQLQTVVTGDFSSFLNTTPLLSMKRSGNRAVIQWGYGTLQSASTLAGTWHDETSAVSPLIVAPTDAQKFYRVKR